MFSSIVFGGGCFWCVEAAMLRLRGVDKVTSGYTGGKTPNPTYDDVSSGDSGHVEVVKVDFDPTVITFYDLLNVFFGMHDPTTRNRQGNDVGEQYASVIFVTSDEQRVEAEDFIAELTREGTFVKPIVTEVKTLEAFYPAENYHQRYYDNNREQGYCSVIIDPKIVKLRQKFAHLLKKDA
ncbi:MAG: peptide-methionine (S)-S-oxide reductase MsrA [Candidatus Uhrbacteria bacterium]|nr:peptide-methionine (S)-S-oxide reductase MsrA [Candidatus Uhrbacteria bacterium]